MPNKLSIEHTPNDSKASLGSVAVSGLKIQVVRQGV